MTSSIRLVTGLITLVAVAIVVAAMSVAEPISQPGRARGAVEEAQEQRELTERRLVALEAARQAGRVGVTEPIQQAAAAGWAGERILNAAGDDWEPAIAADPGSSFVYVMHNRFGGTPACASNCPNPALLVRVSSDGGATWGAERFACVCKRVGGQHDPLLEVVPSTGHVYAVWMNDFNIVFSKSTNRGATWSTPVPVYGKVSWGDKPNFATSANGQHVYVLFNGPTGGDVHAAASHDFGATWTQVKATNDTRYHFAYGTAVDPDTGRIVSTQISFDYGGPGGSARGQVFIHVIASDNGGATWTDTVIDRLELGSPCDSDSCYADYYDSGPALAADDDGDLVVVYSGASANGGPRTVYESSSTDFGRTWNARTTLSSAGSNAAFTAAAGDGNNVVKVWFGEQRNNRWNVWYRSSSDLGGTWSAAVKISDATSGTVYKDANGFREVYGDYGEMAITNAGKAIGVWGEGESYFGPGGVWLNREL